MGADNTFKLKIVASNRVFYDGRAQTLVIPAIDGGEVGFLAQHENCVTPVEVGEMRIKDTQGKIITPLLAAAFWSLLTMRPPWCACLRSCPMRSTPAVLRKPRSEQKKKCASTTAKWSTTTPRPTWLAPWSACVSSSAIPDNFSEYRSKGPVHTNRSFF